MDIQSNISRVNELLEAILRTTKDIYAGTEYAEIMSVLVHELKVHIDTINQRVIATSGIATKYDLNEILTIVRSINATMNNTGVKEVDPVKLFKDSITEEEWRVIRVMQATKSTDGSTTPGTTAAYIAKQLHMTKDRAYRLLLSLREKQYVFTTGSKASTKYWLY